MLMHTPNGWADLESMFKRAVQFAQQGEIPANHPLAAAWANVKMFLDAHEGEQDVDSIVLDARTLDWFATRVDAYAQKHMLTGDPGFAAIAFEWLHLLPFIPPAMTTNARLMARFRSITQPNAEPAYEQA